ncbi:alpha/beta hydrolase [Corynebacterium lizhenjunii]|uniref:Alpha/beta hydrolase n=1 Tax=Corynebacterium lizhenjunii TaxID=2709394 RepID=A0A7T0KED9_9CORY|nr:alpha/beta hydrolase [Corynebacterium lizhenjunii]QPK78730.1 alpha/beta hydrolase [Corynebacterium lizhenjunii]
MPRVWPLMAAAGVGAYVCSRRRHIRAVDPQLRHPLLYLPMHVLPDAAFVTASQVVARRRFARRAGDGVEVQEVVQRSPEGVEFEARVLRPAGVAEDAPVVVFTHGGGHLIGSAGYYDPLNSRIAQELGVIVVAPEYPKATVAPFPADHEACYAALRWAQERSAGPVAVCGDSAGGGLAAGIVHRALDEGHPVDFLALIYPMLDHRTGTSAVADGGAVSASVAGPHAVSTPVPGRGQFVWTANTNRGAWATYLGAGPAQVNDYASPAVRADFAGLPPVWVGIGELDLFFDEAQAYARAVNAAGGHAEFVTYPRAYHGFDQLRPQASVSQRLVADLIAAIRPHVEGGRGRCG